MNTTAGRGQMNVYVWNNPLKVDWGGSILYAVAETLEEAMAEAERGMVSNYGYIPEAQSLDFSDIGPPDRIIAAPYAEIYRWQE